MKIFSDVNRTASFPDHRTPPFGAAFCVVDWPRKMPGLADWLLWWWLYRFKA
jgi:hypothetical protein